MEYDFTEIFSLADEIGADIKNSELYQKYNYLSEKLKNNEEAKSILDQFNLKSKAIQWKYQNAEEVNKEDEEDMRILAEQMKKNNLLNEYLEVKSKLLLELNNIQSILNNSL